MATKILIVDDDPEIVELIRHILDDQNFEIVEAATGATALELAVVEQPALVLLDVLLPGELSGHDVCRRLRENPATANQRIVMLSGQARSSHRAQGLAAGADDYITKPIDPRDMITRLTDLVERPHIAQPPALLLTQMMHGVLAMLEAELGWLLALDRHGKRLKPAVIVARSGDETARAFLNGWQGENNRAAVILDEGDTFLTAVIRSGESLIAKTTDQIDALPGGDLFVRGMQAIETATATILPITLRGTTLGVLVCLFEAREPGRGADSRLLAVAAMQVALGLENERLLAQAERQDTESRRAQRFHETLVDAMGDGLLVLDDKGRVDFVNRRLCRMLGYTQDEIVGRPFSDFVNPAERQRVHQMLRGSLAQTSSFERSLMRSDGTPLPALVVHVPQPEESDADIGEILVVSDLSQQKSRESALLRQTRQLAAINHAAQAMAASLDLDAVPQTILEETVQVLGAKGGAILLVDDDTKDLHFRAVVGPQSESLLGQRVPVGRGIVGWIAEHGQPTLVDDVANDPRFYKRIDEKTGLTTTSAIGVPLLLKRQLIGVLEVINKIEGKFDKGDLSLLESLAQPAASAIVNARLYRDQRNHAIELEHAYVELKRADRLKDEMIQNVSHELRTPMTFILGYIELIANGELGELSEDQQQGVDVVRNKARALTKIVNDIVTLQRMSVDTLDRRLMEVPAIIDQAARTVSVTAQDSGFVVRTDVPEDIPNVRADEERISQVLDNLIGNAIKFSPAGGEIWLRVRRQGDYVRFEVQDSGIGINSDNLGNIFKRFYQEDGSTTRRYGGVGLGLTICKEIVEAHGGEIWAESEPGQGSTFCFTLPYVNEPALK